MLKIVPFQIAVRTKITCKRDGNCAVAKVKIVFTPFRWHLWLLHRARSLESILFWGKFSSTGAVLYAFKNSLSFFVRYSLFLSNASNGDQR